MTTPMGVGGRSTPGCPDCITPSIDFDSTVELTPSCFGMDYDASDHEDCGGCKYRGPCAQRCHRALGRRHVLQPGDLGYVSWLPEVPSAGPPTSINKLLIWCVVAAVRRGDLESDELFIAWNSSTKTTSVQLRLANILSALRG
jgi:hypothetical protein